MCFAVGEEIGQRDWPAAVAIDSTDLEWGGCHVGVLLVEIGVVY